MHLIFFPQPNQRRHIYIFFPNDIIDCKPPLIREKGIHFNPPKDRNPNNSNPAFDESTARIVRVSSAHPAHVGMLEQDR